MPFDLFPPPKAPPGGVKQCGPGSWGPPGTHGRRDVLWLYGGVHGPPLSAPQNGMARGRRALTGLQMGCLTTPAVLSPLASCEESLPHYPASITHPHGSTELKEIFYDPTLRYVLLKAEHQPPLPHSSDQRLCCFFFPLPPKLLLPSLLFPRHPIAWVGCRAGPGSPGRGGQQAMG